MRKLSLLLIMIIVMALAAPVTFAIREVTPEPTPSPEPTAPPATPTAIPQPPAPDDLEPEDEDEDQDEGEDDGETGNLVSQAGDRITSGDAEGAIELLNEAVQINPLNDEAYALRGIANAQLGRLQRAIDDYTQALEIKNYEWTYYTFRANT